MVHSPGRVIFLLLCKLVYTSDIEGSTKMASLVRDVWLYIFFWSVSGSLHPGGHIIVLKHKLDRLSATIPFCQHGPPRWEASRQRILPSLRVSRLNYLCVQVCLFRSGSAQKVP
jgi:hypothetical protein